MSINRTVQSIAYDRATGVLTVGVAGGRFDTVLAPERDCVECDVQVKTDGLAARGLQITITAETFGPSPGTEDFYTYSVEPAPQAEEVEVQV